MISNRDQALKIIENSSNIYQNSKDIKDQEHGLNLFIKGIEMLLKLCKGNDFILIFC